MVMVAGDKNTFKVLFLQWCENLFCGLELRFFTIIDNVPCNQNYRFKLPVAPFFNYGSNNSSRLFCPLDFSSFTYVYITEMQYLQSFLLLVPALKRHFYLRDITRKKTLQRIFINLFFVEFFLTI